jgi:hypothetical protein
MMSTEHHGLCEQFLSEVRHPFLDCSMSLCIMLQIEHRRALAALHARDARVRDVVLLAPSL